VDGRGSRDCERGHGRSAFDAGFGVVGGHEVKGHPFAGGLSGGEHGRGGGFVESEGTAVLNADGWGDVFAWRIGCEVEVPRGEFGRVAAE